MKKMKKSVKNLQDGFIKFHGCGVYRRDGTNKLSTKKKDHAITQ